MGLKTEDRIRIASRLQAALETDTPGGAWFSAYARDVMALLHALDEADDRLRDLAQREYKLRSAVWEFMQADELCQRLIAEDAPVRAFNEAARRRNDALIQMKKVAGYPGPVPGGGRP